MSNEDDDQFVKHVERWRNNEKKSGFEPIDMKETCMNPEHRPPNSLFIQQGQQYRHICPECGYETVLKSVQVTC